MAVVSHINCQGGSKSRTLDRLERHLLLWSQDKFLSLKRFTFREYWAWRPFFCRDRSSSPGNGCWTVRRYPRSGICLAKRRCTSLLLKSHPSARSGSPWVFPTTLGIDAFTHPWPNVSLYAFPPIKLIPAVLCRVKVSGARLLLIAPFWPSQTWFSELTPLLYRPSLGDSDQAGLTVPASGQDLASSAGALEVMGMAHTGPRAVIDSLPAEV